MGNDNILVFQHNENWANEKTNKYLKKKLFKTKDFSKEFKIERTRKVYVPFYEFQTNNNIHAFIEFTSKNSDNYYTDYYYERIIDARLKNLISGGKNLNETYISNILPYNLRNLHDLNEANSDCEIIKDIKDVENVKETNVNDISENMKKIAIKSCPIFIPEFKHITSKVTTNYENDRIVYLPIWIVEVRTSEKTYEFYINDQTGKIAGDVPTNQFSDWKLFVKICLLVSLLFIILTFISVKFKSDIILYAVGAVLALLVLFFIYIGITNRYSMKYKFSNATVLSKKYIKKKRYWITELYQKARNEFEKERDTDTSINE